MQKVELIAHHKYIDEMIPHIFTQGQPMMRHSIQQHTNTDDIIDCESYSWLSQRGLGMEHNVMSIQRQFSSQLRTCAKLFMVEG